jgi:putative ABC transport system permease protein
VAGPAIMSFLILLIACFNFTNISISFASSRLKEIGIRKILGGVRQQLIRQFLVENVVLCLLASILAIFFVITLLPSFNGIAGLDLRFNLKDLSLYLFLFSLPLFTALISGLYPSLYISSFKPISILKGQTTFGDSNLFTKFLLCAQFSLTCFALIVGISLTKNAYFQASVDYGYAINELAVLEVNNVSEFNILSNTLKANPQVRNIAGTVNQIGEGSPVLKVETGGRKIDATVTTIGGEEYLKTTGVTLKEGRHFYSNQSMDAESSVLVNESLLPALNIKLALGHRIKVDSTFYTIVGVVKNYKEAGLHGEVTPIVLKLGNPENFRYLTVRADKTNLRTVYKAMQDTWHHILPGKPFRGFMQNELIEKELYMNEGIKSVSFFLAITTIALSASGIFALISLNIIRRRKEIGMRKILGASIFSIISILNKSYIRLMLLSFVIGSTIGFLLIDNLLFRFIYAYHADIGAMPFILTLIILMLASAITIGTKVYKAAISNPVKTLRDD